jgi:apolipoprotein N-acyltransferase
MLTRTWQRAILSLMTVPVLAASALAQDNTSTNGSATTTTTTTTTSEWITDWRVWAIVGAVLVIILVIALTRGRGEGGSTTIVK